MVTRAEAKIHRVGPRHTIYLAKDLVEDSTFPFRADEDLMVRIEGDALIIDKDGRSGRRTDTPDAARSHKDKILMKTLDVLNFSSLTSKAERINQMLSEIHEAEMLESRVRHIPKNEHAIFLWEKETFLDMVLAEFFDPRVTGKAPKGLLSAKPSTLESVNNMEHKDFSGLDKPAAIRKIRDSSHQNSSGRLLVVFTKRINKGTHGTGAEHRAYSEGEHDNPLRLRRFKTD